MRWKLIAAVLVAVLVAGGATTLVLLRHSGGAASGPGVTAKTTATPNPSPTATSSTPAPTPTPTPSASPTPSATPSATASVAGACTGNQLDMVVGAATSAAGGQEDITALLGNDGGNACDLSGTLQVQLLDSKGSVLPTSQASAPTGQAWLVPDRVALDPWEPQPGEASVLISWHTGNTGPGVCSGSAPVAAQLSVTAPGGGTVIATVQPSPALPEGMAPCQGAIQLGAITGVSTVPTSTTDAQDAADAAVEQEEGQPITSSCTPTARQGCLTRSGNGTLGTDSAYFEYESYGIGSGAVCFAYVYQDAAGWHPLDVLCTQDLTPADGGTVAISVPGGGCVNVHAAPGHASHVISCVSPGAQTTYVVEQGPVYVAETDPTTHLAMGTIWWYLSGLGGWVAQDFIASPNG